MGVNVSHFSNFSLTFCLEAYPDKQQRNHQSSQAFLDLCAVNPQVTSGFLLPRDNDI